MLLSRSPSSAINNRDHPKTRIETEMWEDNVLLGEAGIALLSAGALSLFHSTTIKGWQSLC
jgi:hypothetical protein